jgi:hypothetical protein
MEKWFIIWLKQHCHHNPRNLYQFSKEFNSVHVKIKIKSIYFTKTGGPNIFFINPLLDSVTELHFALTDMYNIQKWRKPNFLQLVSAKHSHSNEEQQPHNLQTPVFSIILYSRHLEVVYSLWCNCIFNVLHIIIYFLIFVSFQIIIYKLCSNLNLFSISYSHAYEIYFTS